MLIPVYYEKRGRMKMQDLKVFNLAWVWGKMTKANFLTNHLLDLQWPMITAQ